MKHEDIVFRNVSSYKVEKFRKEHYWRGFRACMMIMLAPLSIGFIIYCYQLQKLFN